jgi:hypothetical protein
MAQAFEAQPVGCREDRRFKEAAVFARPGGFNLLARIGGVQQRNAQLCGVIVRRLLQESRVMRKSDAAVQTDKGIHTGVSHLQEQGRLPPKSNPMTPSLRTSA